MMIKQILTYLQGQAESKIQPPARELGVRCVPKAEVNNCRTSVCN